MQLPLGLQAQQETILHITKKVSEEAPYHLVHEFGLSLMDAQLCLIIAKAGVEGVPRAALTKMAHGQETAVHTHISKLRSCLKSFDIQLKTTGNDYWFDRDSREKIECRLKRFREAKREICALLETPSLEISGSDLPQDPKTSFSLLQNLLRVVRGAPEKSPIAETSLAPSAKLVLGVCQADLARGQNYSFKHRLALAVYPPFTPPTLSDPSILVDAHLRNMRTYFGCEVPKRNFQVLPIEKPVRDFLSRSVPQGLPAARPV